MKVTGSVWEADMVTLFLTSALMVIVILIIRFLFKNKLSFLILYPLWGLVLLRLLVPVTIIESPLSIMNLVNITDNKKNVQTAKEEKLTINNKPEENKNSNKTSNKNTTKQFINKNGKNTNINSTFKNNIIITDKEPDIKNTEENTAAGLAKDTKQKTQNKLVKPVAVIWISGSIIFFTFIIISNSIFYKKLKKSRQLMFKSSHNIPIYISGIVKTPCLTGIIHPVVYLPADNNIKEKYLTQILAHEYTHIKHKDNIWALLRTICLGIYWFYPFVWIAAFYSKQDAELACDEAVLKNCTNNEKYNYGKMLLLMSQKGKQGAFYLATSLGSSKSNLKERVTMLTKNNKYKIWHVALITTFSIILAGCGMTARQTENINTSNTIQTTKNSAGNNNNSVPDTSSPASNKEPGINPSEDERIKSFEKFMKKEIKECPEWKKLKDDTSNLYFSIQYTSDNTPCLFVTPYTFQGSGKNSSYSWVYYYDTDNKKTELLTYIACSSSGEPVSIIDGKFVSNTHHSYRTYTYNSNTKNILESEEVSGYYIYDSYTEKQSDNFTYIKYEWKLPFSHKTRLKLQKKPIDKYTSDTSTTRHYNVPDALNFSSKYSEASPIIFYKNTPDRWHKFYKDGHMPSPGYYGIISGNVDKNILKSINNINDDDFDKARKNIPVTINGTLMSYCGELPGNVELYYLNSGYTARAFITLSGRNYNVYGVSQKEYKNLKPSDNSPVIIPETGKPEFINGDFDNDGEDETAFYLTENPYTAKEYQTLYIIDYLYDYSYEEYGIITSALYGLYSYTKDDYRYFIEQLCENYDKNPKLLSPEILNSIKNKTKNNNYKSKINIIPDNSFEDYNYILSNNKLNNEYEFGNSCLYNITPGNSKDKIKVSIGITYNQKGKTEKHQLNIEASLLFKNSTFTLAAPFSVNTN